MWTEHETWGWNMSWSLMNFSWSLFQIIMPLTVYNLVSSQVSLSVLCQSSVTRLHSLSLYSQLMTQCSLWQPAEDRAAPLSAGNIITSVEIMETQRPETVVSNQGGQPGSSPSSHQGRQSLEISRQSSTGSISIIISAISLKTLAGWRHEDIIVVYCQFISKANKQIVL